MKKTLALMAALAALTSSVKAELVESYITIALKFYVNTTDEVVEKGDSVSINYSTFSLKNFDLIDAYGEVNNIGFDKSAKLIRQDEFNEEGNLIDSKILIRDKTQEGDVDITDSFSFSFLIEAQKFKYSKSKGTGTYSVIYSTNVNFLAEPENEDESEEFDLYNIERFSGKTILFNGSLVDLENSSSKAQGYAYFYVSKLEDYFEGVVEGTIKISGAKAIKVLE